MSSEGINVLSLFDGISCGRIALERSNIKVKNYFASEIDKHAIKVSKKNYPDIIHIGDVNNIFDNNLPNIDLLIGGSPCQGFSFAGKQLNFDDPRSKLFFKYVEALNYYNPKYFLFENVKMKKDYVQIISNHLGIDPIEINSNLVSVQNRKRLYWTNINVYNLPDDKELYFNKELKRLKHGYIKEEIKFFEKYPSICAQAPYTKYVLLNGEKITPEDYEKFQTIPQGYSDCLNKTNRWKVVGNAWTVDIISHILNFMEVEEI